MSITIHYTFFDEVYIILTKKVIAHDLPKKFVKLVYSKLNFVTLKNTYKYFKKEDTSNILIRTICLLEIRITLTQVQQIIIVDLNYNTCSSN